MIAVIKDLFSYIFLDDDSNRELYVLIHSKIQHNTQHERRDGRNNYFSLMKNGVQLTIHKHMKS